MPKVNLDGDSCTLCQTCVSTCPMGVYEFDNEKIIVAQEDQCIVCRACEAACPVGAITIEE
jgi:NAD-dependent dihydropyrimidine dehydrogenase PreA subunit